MKTYTDSRGRFCAVYKGMEFRTNTEGEGLWEYKESDSSWHQILGTGQIQVNNSKQLYRKVSKIYHDL